MPIQINGVDATPEQLASLRTELGAAATTDLANKASKTVVTDLSLRATRLEIDKDFTTFENSVAVYTEGYPTYRIPAICCTNKGTLIAMFDGRNAAANDAPSPTDIVMRRSFDGGVTWEAQVLIADNPSGGGSADASLTVNVDTGRIHAFWYTTTVDIFASSTGNSNTATNIVQIDYAYSDNDGANWTIKRITNDIKNASWKGLFATSGHGIQLRNGPKKGRLLQPFAVMNPAVSSSVWCAGALYSDDDGATWQFGSLTATAEFDENKLVELSDGRIMMNSRLNGATTRKLCYSSDNGQTWGAVTTSSALTVNAVNADLQRVDPDNTSPDKDKLLFSVPVGGTRKNLCINLSEDNGVTYSVTKSVNLPADYAAYSVMVRMGPDDFAVLWEGDRLLGDGVTKLQGIHFFRFSIRRWLKDGLTSARTLKKGVVDQTTLDAAKAAATSIAQQAVSAIPSASVKTYSPSVYRFGYNGRRGNGSLLGQGFTATLEYAANTSATAGGTVIQGSASTNANTLTRAITHPDAQGGFTYAHGVTATSGTGEWYATQTVDLAKFLKILTFGGEFKLTSKITDTYAASRRMAGFAAYVHKSNSLLPSGALTGITGVDLTKVGILSHLIESDSAASNILFRVMKEGSTAANPTFSTLVSIPFDNNYHTFGLKFAAGATPSVTPYIDSTNGAASALVYGGYSNAGYAAPAAADTTTKLVITDITQSKTHDFNMDVFDFWAYQDDGNIPLDSADISHFVELPDYNRSHTITIPDYAVSQGKSLEIYAENVGNIIVKGANSNVLIKALGGSIALPVQLTMSRAAGAAPASYKFVQVGADGKTWVRTA